MRAVVWHGTEDVRVDEVADPAIRSMILSMSSCSSMRGSGVKSNAEYLGLMMNRSVGLGAIASTSDPAGPERTCHDPRRHRR